MGSTKKHKKDRESSSSSRRHKNRSRSRSQSPHQESPDRDRDRDRKHKKRRRERSRSPERKRDYQSDSKCPESRPCDQISRYSILLMSSLPSGSDCVEVPVDSSPPVEKSKPRAPPPPEISKCPPPPRMRSPSPIPEGGLGDSLSIEETNKLRAKLGLKPLEVDSGPKPSSAPKRDAEKDTSDISEDESKITDDLGEFYHKPAANLTELKNAEKIREKIKERREKRKLEESLKKTKTLGESDSDDDVNKWVDRNREIQRLKREAEKRAKLLEEMDEELQEGPVHLDNRRRRNTTRDEYKYSSLKGLKVDHDVSEFQEGKTVILTLKDADVLDEEAKDTLVNVNIMDTERYRKNIENKKYKPGQSYGYECYDDDDEEGNALGMRSVLKKYDDEIGGAKKSSFVIGSTADAAEELRRKQMEIKCKLENKRLVTLNEQLIRPASEYYTEEEMSAKFKKPKKKKGSKKLRTKVTADDLLPLAGDVPDTDLRTFRGRHGADSDEEMKDVAQKPRGGMKTEIKSELEDDDLERVLSKARRLKQKEAIIKKSIPAIEIKEEVKEEIEDGEGFDFMDNKIVLNETAEFCRTLGDIPTYGMAGNRETDLNDMMDLEEDEEQAKGVQHKDADMDLDDDEEDEGLEGSRRGQWNSVQEERNGIVHVDLTGHRSDVAEPTILDDEPDVGSGVAGALRLAMSKGYLEKEESNKPSNSRMAYLQAKNYSIDDKQK